MISKQFTAECSRQYAKIVEDFSKSVGITPENVHRVTRVSTGDNEAEFLMFDASDTRPGTQLGEIRSGFRLTRSGGLEWFVDCRKTASVDEARSEIAEANDRIATLECGMKYLKREIGKLEAAAARQTEEVNSCRVKIEALLADLDEKTMQLEKAEEANGICQEDLNSLQNREMNNERRIESLTRQLAGAKRLAKQYEDSWNDAEQRLIQLQTSIKPRTRGMQS